MSTTAQGIDARGALCGWLAGLTDMYTKDVKAIPEDKWHATHGGCTKSASELTADAIGMLDWTTEALKGNVVEVTESYVGGPLKEACATKEGTVAKLASSSAAFSVALAGASDEALNSMVTPPWKMDAPLYILANIAVSHLWYHDGQLNYIQSLLGDDQVHWMDQ